MTQTPDQHPSPRSPGAIAVVGAGPGIGRAVAERFGTAGYRVGLVARDAERLEAQASELAERTGATATTATADATDPDAVRQALASVASELGPISVLCFSPIPDTGLIKPVLETGPDELMASLQLNVGGAAAAVRAVIDGMLAEREGSLLFTTGSAAINADPARAASAVTTTAATTYLSLLRQALEGTGVRVGHTVIVGPIDRDRPTAHHPDSIAADLWAHHSGEARQFPTVLRLG